MAATVYDDPRVYIKYNRNKRKKDECDCDEKKNDHEEDCDCGECKKSCGCEEKKDCGCCPSGLVAVYDDNDELVGCLTPNDAELYMKNTIKCQDGFGKLFKVSTGEFLGCFTAADIVTLYALINPA